MLDIRQLEERAELATMFVQAKSFLDRHFCPNWDRIKLLEYLLSGIA